MSTTIKHTVTWEGRNIRLSYSPKQYGFIDHVAIEADDEQPLPMTDTGFRSHYFGPMEPSLNVDEVADMVIDWLNAEAQSKVWKAHVDASRQGTLF